MAAGAILTHTGNKIYKLGPEYINRKEVRIIAAFKNGKPLYYNKDYITAGPDGIKVLCDVTEDDTIQAKVINKRLGNKLLGKYRN